VAGAHACAPCILHLAHAVYLPKSHLLNVAITSPNAPSPGPCATTVGLPDPRPKLSGPAVADAGEFGRRTRLAVLQRSLSWRASILAHISSTGTLFPCICVWRPRSGHVVSQKLAKTREARKAQAERTTTHPQQLSSDFPEP
jgi:hypothetical protein